jgi:hypothetical protein
MEKVFGDKKRFAIEIRIESNVDKSNLRIWINNTPLGYFKRNGKLVYSIRSLKKILLCRHYLFEPLFENMPPEKIYEWVIGTALNENPIPENVKEFHRRQIFSFFWGDQLDEFSTICYFRSNNFYWIIEASKEKKTLSFSSDETDVIPVIESYIDWYETTYGKVIVKNITLLNNN